MKRFTALLIALALIAGMVGCPAAPVPEPPVQYSLTVLSSEGGSVTSPGEGTFTYTAGTVVELVVVPDDCYRFANWTGDTVVSPESASTTITVDAAKSVTASFALERYSLTIGSTDGGSVTTPGEGTFEYGCGAAISLAADPDEGYRFDKWAGDIGTMADPASADTTITMNDNYSIGASFAPLYATSETVFLGLSLPAVHTRDGQGRIYLTESDPLLNKWRISRFDPDTGEAVQLIEHGDSSIRWLSLDGQGTLYYVLSHHTEPPVNQIRRLLPGEADSCVLLSTEVTDQLGLPLTADSSGNLYFALQSSAGLNSPSSWRLHRIPVGTTAIETLLTVEDCSRIWSVRVSDDSHILYFISDEEGVHRIYMFDLESGVLDIILERTSEHFGNIAYLATRSDGELYYLYRQRSDVTALAHFGYLEIGRFTLEALETAQPPQLLVAEELDREVAVWAPSTLGVFAVSDSGDVFFAVVLFQEGLIQQARVGIFWFNPLTGVYVSLIEATMQEVYFYSFVLDDEGCVYYSARDLGTIGRINR